jgi:hypothetical protein
MQRIKVSFDAWIQLLGMLGVIGSLIFVAMQMRQSHQFALDVQYNSHIGGLTYLFSMKRYA